MGRAFECRRAAKEKRSDNLSKIFPRLSKAITMAAKDGGPDPDMNAKLRTAIMNAKAQNMPKNNIASAIERASGKDAADYAEINYEGKGPHGSLIFVECATDNGTRTVANIKMYFNKNGGEVVKTGSLEFMFDRKAVFEFKKTDEVDLEELELALIDAGLEEFEVEDDMVYVYGEYTSFGTLSQAFEDQKVDLEKASLQRIPTTTVELTEEQIADVEKLVDIIEEDDDVQAVFTNLA